MEERLRVPISARPSGFGRMWARGLAAVAAVAALRLSAEKGGRLGMKALTCGPWSSAREGGRKGSCQPSWAGPKWNRRRGRAAMGQQAESKKQERKGKEILFLFLFRICKPFQIEF